MNKKPPTKDEIADTFEATAQLLELKGENQFKVRAYQNAARAVELFPGDLAAAARTEELEATQGIGERMAEARAGTAGNRAI